MVKRGHEEDFGNPGSILFLDLDRVLWVCSL